MESNTMVDTRVHLETTYAIAQYLLKKYIISSDLYIKDKNYYTRIVTHTRKSNGTLT